MQKDKRQPTEEDFDKVYDRLRAKDPLFDLKAEYGSYLMKHVNDLTTSEKNRMLEIEKFLENNTTN